MHHEPIGEPRGEEMHTKRNFIRYKSSVVEPILYFEGVLQDIH